MLQCLLLTLVGSIIFVDPEGVLDKTNRLGANLHNVVDATFGWRFPFNTKPIRNPRRLVIAVRVLGGAVVTISTLFLYDALLGLA
jgi:hypothetical protein